MRRFERYRESVQASDRRHRFWVRGAVVAGSAVFGFMLLWNAGVNVQDIRAWFHSAPKPAEANRTRVIPKAPTVASLHNAQPVGRMGTDSSASKTPLRLVLVRTEPGQNTHSGKAMVGVDREHPQTYLAGAILENGARIDEIYRDHVMLVKGGQHTPLYLDHEAASEPAVRKDSALLLVGGLGSGAPHPHYSEEPVTDFVRPVPVYRAGVIAGFQVYPGNRPAPFNKWGLKAGDVITDLDGQPVTDPDQVLELLHGLLEGEALQATVRRDGGTPIAVSLDGTDVQRMHTASNSAPPTLPAGAP
jgi:general secretion pathway protein C